MQRSTLIPLAFFGLRLAVACMGQESSVEPRPDKIREEILGNDSLASLAALKKAKQLGDPTLVSLGLESGFMSIRRQAALMLTDAPHPELLESMVAGYDAGQGYATGGTESVVLKEETNEALVLAMDMALHPAATHSPKHSQAESEAIVREARQWVLSSGRNLSNVPPDAMRHTGIAPASQSKSSESRQQLLPRASQPPEAGLANSTLATRLKAVLVIVLCLGTLVIIIIKRR
jgi:hypothetical protein